MNEDTTKISPTPLAKIALTCSGGGYRAASFHLGTMSYLNRLQFQGKPLLQNVKMISTVSGGTITGIVYALYCQQGKSFDETYAFLMDKLRRLDLLKMGIEKLNPDAQWNNPFKRKNLINAFAELYDAHFTGGATFEVLDKMTCHLEAVAFNSTEFNNAIDFRFRNRGTGFFGNYYNRVTNAQAGEIKLADAMAASSCFPGGFEPILWPSDFTYTGAEELTKIASKKPTGIMDGGIYDNQGIDSVLRYKSSAETAYFDCMIISDVASPYMNPYQPTPVPPKQGINKVTLAQLYRRVRDINRLVNVFMPCLCLLLLALPLAWGYRNRIPTGICLATSAILGLIWIGKLVLVRRLLRLPGRVKAFILEKNPQAEFYLQKLSALKIGSLSLHRAKPLLMDRLNSLLVLLLSVFLKIVRRLNYNIAYTDDRLQYRRISTLIHQLTYEDFEAAADRPPVERTPAVMAHSILNGDYLGTVGTKIHEVAEAAADFGTTLWFTPEDQLDDTLGKLVATGQFTMCYNLIAYLESIVYGENNGFSELSSEAQTDLRGLLDQCKADWVRFKDNPFIMSGQKG